MGDEFDTSEDISLDDATDDYQIFEDDNDIGGLMDDTDDFLPEPDSFDADVESLLNNTEEGSVEELEEILDSNTDIDGNIVNDSSLDSMSNAEIEEDGNIDSIMNEVTNDEDSLPDAAPYLSEIEALNNTDEGSAEQLEEILKSEEGTAEQLEEILDSNTDIDGNIVDDSELIIAPEITSDGSTDESMYEIADSVNPALDLEDSIQETTLTGEEFDEQKPQLVNSTNASINNDDNPFLSDPSDSGSIEPQSKSPLDLKAVNSQGGKKPGDILAAVTAGTSLLSGVTGYVDAYEELNNQQPETISPISYTQETNIENLQDDLATLGVEYVDPDVQIQDSQISDIQDALQTIDAGYIEPETIGEMKAEEHLKRIEEMSEEEQVFKIETLLDPPKNNNQSSAKQFNETIATDTTQNTVDTIYDTPKVDDISEWLGEINPNYDPFDWDSPYCNNCGSCAFAVQKRFEGDSNIVATSENIGTIEEMNALTGMEQVPMSPNEIADYLISQGPGACGIVGIDRVSGPGHWFNAYYDGTKVVAIDAQTGQISDWPPDYGDVTNWDISVRKEVKSCPTR